MRRTAPRGRHIGIKRARTEPDRLGPKRAIDQVVEILCCGDVAAQTEEHIAQCPTRHLFHPDAAVEERGDAGNAGVDRREPAPVGLNADAVAGLRLKLQLRSEEHTSELQSHVNLVCRLLLEKKKKILLYLPNKNYPPTTSYTPLHPV